MENANEETKKSGKKNKIGNQKKKRERESEKVTEKKEFYMH